MSQKLQQKNGETFELEKNLLKYFNLFLWNDETLMQDGIEEENSSESPNKNCTEYKIDNISKETMEFFVQIANMMINSTDESNDPVITLYISNLLK